MMSLSTRVPSFFWSSSNSLTCRVVNMPSSTRASAIRSPKLLTGGMGLAENFTDGSNQLLRWNHVPDQMTFGEFFKLVSRLFIERISGCNQNGFAHPVERQNTPPLTNLLRKSPGQFDIDVIFVDEQITNSGPL